MELTDQTNRAGMPRRILGSRLILALVGGALLGAALALLSPGPFLTGWLAASLLSIPALYLLHLAWGWAGAGRALGWMMALAFALRLVCGVGLSLALPVYGYPTEPEQQSGYLFFDAYNRDTQAWSLVEKGEPLWFAFKDDMFGDQYGGLMYLSAAVYRFLSPDAHRPFLILLLGVFFAALGLPFLVQAARLRWGMRIALIAGWIYALYPDGIFFASSQLREPFLYGLACIAFYTVITWAWRRPRSWIVLILTVLAMGLLSTRVAAAMVGLLGLFFLIEHVVGRSEPRWQLVGWVSLAVGALLVMAYSWNWFRSSSAWDMVDTDTEAGRIQFAIDELSGYLNLPREDLRAPVITAYGLARPVLPAAVVSNAKSELWKNIGIVRSAGWYALAPFLLYALFTVWKEPDPRKRRRVIWLALAVVTWLVISSARGGGDVTDNPRYRTLFLPWLALLAGWAIHWALAHKDAWLWRWVAVELVALGFFTQWYISRYYRIWYKLPFWVMVLLILGIGGAILVGGWLWDRRSVNKAVLASGSEQRPSQG